MTFYHIVYYKHYSKLNLYPHKQKYKCAVVYGGLASIMRITQKTFIIPLGDQTIFSANVHGPVTVG